MKISTHLLGIFMIYSVLGWLCETVYCSLGGKRFVKRGFLYGPYCPIYGFGGLTALVVSHSLTGNPVLVFLISMVSAAIIEYGTGWILEALFQIRWWDYSSKKWQLNGRICLKTSVIFGFMGCALVYFIHPVVTDLVHRIPYELVQLIVNFSASVMLIDLLITMNRLLGFTDKLQKTQNEIHMLKELNLKYDWYNPKDLNGSLEKLQSVYDGDFSKEAAGVLKRLDSIAENRKKGFHSLNAYPTMRSGKWAEALEAVRAERKQKKAQRQPAHQRIFHWVTEKSVFAGKTAQANVAAYFNYKHLFWVFVIASVLGYVVESIFCIVTRGVLESRQGLVFGPFSQVYGIAAVVMVLVLTPLKAKNDRWLFFGSALLGGFLEVVMSLMQEWIFGSVSWHYTSEYLAVAGGRTNLLYMLFWGILGVIFIKEIHPRFTKMIEAIPPRQNNTLVAVLTVILAVDIFISGTAVYRWSERSHGAAPNNGYEVFLDEYYDDEEMERVYPNLVILERK